MLRIWDVVYNFDPADAEDWIESWCSTSNAPDAGGWSRDELEEHVRDEYSTSSWLLESMMRRTGFIMEDAQYSDDGMFAQYVLPRPD